MEASEREMVDLALGAMKKETGLSFKVEAEDVLIGTNRRADAVVSLKLPNAEIPLYIEAKRQLSRQAIHQLLQLRRRHKNLFLVTGVMPQEFKRVLRSHGIGYADTKGAFFLPIMSNEEPTWNRVAASGSKTKRTRTGQLAISPGSAGLVFAVICNPELLNSSQRELARLGNASLGLVNLTVSKLVHHGYISKLRNEYRMINREDLVRKWIDSFNRRARPRLFIGRYSTDLELNMKRLPDHRKIITWGGEAAAANMGNLAPPHNYIGYLKKSTLPILQRKLRLYPDKEGNISIFEKFWNVKSTYEENGFCHPLLVSADLLNLESERAAQAAEIIIKEYSR